MKRTVAAAALLLGIASCRGDTAAPAAGALIDRETFVDTYVDLRWTAVHTPDFQLPPGAREEILARHGVEAEDLVRFAEAHGRDLDFMTEVWAEVQTRIDERQADASSGA